MRRDLPLLALLLLTAGCGERQRLNPFDPSNPVTGGRPPGFEALATDQVVTLKWLPTVSPGLRGYELFRRVAGETTFTQISGLLSPSLTATGDFGVQDGVDRTYRLYYVFAQGSGGLPAEDVATPGPLQPWIADFSGGAFRMTADGRHILTEDNTALGPTAIVADVGGGVVWISDSFGGQVIVYTPSTGDHVLITAVETPSALAIDPLDGTAWVCDESLNEMLHFNPNGSVASPQVLGGLQQPEGVAIDPTDRSLWVAERFGNRVRHYSALGSPLGAATLGAPSRVAVDSATHGAWSTSFDNGKVYVMSNTFSIIDSVGGFQGPIGVAVDARRGLIWVADAFAGQVVALHRDKTEAFRIGGLPEVREIAIDLASGEAWVTVPGVSQVVRISPTGSLIRHTGGFGRPYGISLGSSR
jgi:DNA-binding beta-propeller fold protein YncE